MEFIIHEYQGGVSYYLTLEVKQKNNLSFDIYWGSGIITCLAKYVPTIITEYDTILLNYNGKKNNIGEYHFKCKEDINNAIKTLEEKYFVLIKLMGG